MRPGDHPEFFRLPPPEGRSRESSIVLDRDGRFWHDGSRVDHPGMARAFASWIQRHPDDGRYILSNGYDWCYFRVEGTPFFVEAVVERAGRPWLILSDGSEEELSPERSQVSADDALVTAVKGGQFRARFSRAAQTALAPWLTVTQSGEICLEITGTQWPLRDAAAASPTNPH
ncbi:MAG TPA: hypothetical protein VGI10_11990 [Polyangiaceae bacterium]|jgi:hypothetical protein